MAIKHWSFAGLILTYWCNARCQSCYLSCGPERGGAGDEMSVDSALAVWAGLAAACPHGCRIHLSGGEPFGDWPRLLEICRRAHQAGLSIPGGAGPLEKVETNAFWAESAEIVRSRVVALAELGMRKFAISADPYHQQFVPIERCRLAASIAEDVLGADRVQVRWRDWLADGFDTHTISPQQRSEVFARYAAAGRDRYNGRAARALAEDIDLAQCKTVAELADMPCRESLLRGRHVHIDGAMRVMPGTCAGIVLGQLPPMHSGRLDVASVWQELLRTHEQRPIVGCLARAGPVGLLELARPMGFVPRKAYASKCQLCWEVRTFLAGRHFAPQELCPSWLYDDPVMLKDVES